MGALISLVGRLFQLICYFIDRIVYNWIPKLYNVLIAVARTSPLSQADLADMASRIYKLLAVFMIFKVTFSLIMYVVNPDDFSDKSKGVSKLMTNIVISLSLLVLTPYIFSYAYQLQKIILEDNSIATVIFGKDTTNGSNVINSAGDQMTYLAISPFFVPDLSLYPSCMTLYKIDTNDVGDKKLKLNKECFGFEDVNEYSDDPKGKCTGTTTLCATVCNKDKPENECKDSDGFSKRILVNYAAGVQYQNYHMLFRKEAIDARNGDNEFVFDYSYFFSTLVAIIILLFLLTVCMDVALRSIKLAFLQLIAPIPILSYIDPKSGKDGMFKKWYQMCFKTYLHLFVRLLSLYFALYIIGRLNGLSDIIDGSHVTTTIIKIFIMIGALMFAKNFIKILEDLGIKFDGGFELNPIKKFNEQALGGKRITGAAGALTAGAVDRAARLATAPGAKGKLMALAGTPLGLADSAFRGFREGKGFQGGLNSQAYVNRHLREGRIKGLSPTASYLDYAGSIFGLDDATLERESTIINANKEELRKADNDIAEYSRLKELTINSNKRKISPAKDAQSRRKNTLDVAKKMQDMAEDIATKKADFTMSTENARRMALLQKAKADANSLAANEIQELANSGISLNDINGVEGLKYARAINQRSYTTNRRSDEANIVHLNENQGKVLDRDMIIGGSVGADGKLTGEYVIKKGTMVDADVVAAAKAAQGAYIKASKKEVFNSLMNGTAIKAIDGKALDETSQFQADLENYRNDVELANDAINSYNSGLTAEERAQSEITNISRSANNFDDIDKVLNAIKSSEDTKRLDGYVSKYETENSLLTTDIERYKDNYTVTYTDKQNKKHTSYSYDRAKSETKAREDENKYYIEQHQQRRTYLSGMSSKK